MGGASYAAIDRSEPIESRSIKSIRICSGEGVKSVSCCSALRGRQTDMSVSLASGDQAMFALLVAGAIVTFFFSAGLLLAEFLCRRGHSSAAEPGCSTDEASPGGGASRNELR